jgi:hypothetical protein
LGWGRGASRSGFDQAQQQQQQQQQLSLLQRLCSSIAAKVRFCVTVACMPLMAPLLPSLWLLSWLWGPSKTQPAAAAEGGASGGRGGVMGVAQPPHLRSSAAAGSSGSSSGSPRMGWGLRRRSSSSDGAAVAAGGPFAVSQQQQQQQQEVPRAPRQQRSNAQPAAPRRSIVFEEPSLLSAQEPTRRRGLLEVRFEKGGGACKWPGGPLVLTDSDGARVRRSGIGNGGGGYEAEQCKKAWGCDMVHSFLISAHHRLNYGVFLVCMQPLLHVLLSAILFAFTGVECHYRTHHNGHIRHTQVDCTPPHSHSAPPATSSSISPASAAGSSGSSSRSCRCAPYPRQQWQQGRQQWQQQRQQEPSGICCCCFCCCWCCQAQPLCKPWYSCCCCCCCC